MIGKTPQLETEDDQHGKESLDTWIAEAQRGAALSFDFDRSNDAIEGIFADRAIVRDFLDAEKTPVGLEADMPESRQIFESLADAEIARVIDRGFRT